MKRLPLVALGLVALLLTAGQLARAAAGPGSNDIQDSLPFWDQNGVRVAFERTAPGLQHVLSTTSAGKDTYLVYPTGVVRGYLGDRFLIQEGNRTFITIGGRFAGPPTAIDGIDASASTDGTRVAYIRGNDLYVANADGSNERHLSAGVAVPAADVIGPAWSPDGTRIVVASSGGLVLANVDGSGSRILAYGDVSNPSWSPDGKTVAYQQHDDPYDAVYAVDAAGGLPRALVAGSSNARFPQYSPHSPMLLYSSDRQHVRGGATPYQYALYLRDTYGVERKLVDDVHPYSPARWSPTAALIAVSAGQECRRWGIFVVPSSGGAAHRHSNLCRVTGTSGADRLRGSYYFDVIRGLGGNDVIRANPGNDRIEGNDGDDAIEAGSGNDVVFGGNGNDRIFGGAGNDVLIGGNGRDRIDCGPGNDTVEGAGPLDRIARNCEHVRR